MIKKMKKIKIIGGFIIFALLISGCNFNEDMSIQDDNVKKLYNMIETYFIPDTYPGFSSYNESNFYINKLVKYDDLSNESRLYYAYNNIENIERRWFSSCEELKGYNYQNKDVYQICVDSNKEIIEKNQSSEEWFFDNVNKKALEDSYHKMYGENKEMPLTDFTMSVTGTCLYSKEKDDFLCFKQIGGDTFPNHSEAQIERAVNRKDYVEIYDRYLWIELDTNGSEKYYKSRFDDKELIDSDTKDFTKGALYKHIFKKDNNDNYYWYSSERIE